MDNNVCVYLLTLILAVSLGGCEQAEKQSESTNIFMWMGSNNLIEEDPKMYRSMLAFANRHHIIPYESGANTVADLERFLTQTRRQDINRTWIEIGPKRDGLTIKEFVEQPQKRQATLDRFRSLGKTYKSYYPNFARVTIFDEAPLGAFARDPQHDNYQAIFEQFSTYAPKAFALLYNAFKEGFPNAKVGIFLHHPHNASPAMAGRYSYIQAFMRRTDSLGAAPDFIYSDVYRGYFNRGYGQEATDQYITDVVRHTNDVAQQYNANAYQLGQAHTIKLGYTPSQRQIDTNVEAMLAGNPDGIGWYWPNYAGTNVVRSGNGMGNKANVDVSFNPFVPNNWGNIGPAGSLYGTSRDRFSYSYLRMLEATGQINADQSFDLWIYGYDFDHVEHKVWLKSAATQEWTYIGHINPQQDDTGYEPVAGRQHRYSYNQKWHGVAFRGLSREQFFNGDSLRKVDIKISTPGGSDQSQLSAIYIMPYHQTRHYPTEQTITTQIEQQPRWVDINSLASWVRPVPFKLRSDTTSQTTVSAPQSPPDSARYRQWLQSQNPDQ